MRNAAQMLRYRVTKVSATTTLRLRFDPRTSSASTAGSGRVPIIPILLVSYAAKWRHAPTCLLDLWPEPAAHCGRSPAIHGATVPGTVGEVSARPSSAQPSHGPRSYVTLHERTQHPDPSIWMPGEGRPNGDRIRHDARGNPRRPARSTPPVSGLGSSHQGSTQIV